MSNDDLGILLGRAYQSFVDELNAHLASAGFTEVRSSFGYVFRALASTSLTQSELAAQLDITPQGAAKLVNEMVDARYVERHADDSDRRMWRLVLAPRGKDALRTARRFHRDFEARLTRKVGASSAKTLREVLASFATERPLRQV